MVDGLKFIKSPERRMLFNYTEIRSIFRPYFSYFLLSKKPRDEVKVERKVFVSRHKSFPLLVRFFGGGDKKNKIKEKKKKTKTKKRKRGKEKGQKNVRREKKKKKKITPKTFSEISFRL